MGRNSCSGGSTSRMITGSPSIAWKRPRKSARCSGTSSSRASAAFGDRVGHDHALHDRQPLGLEEHVLGAAQADALRAVLPGPLGVLRVVGVRADAQAPILVRPREQHGEPGVGDVRYERVELPEKHLARAAVQRHPVAFLDDQVADGGPVANEVDLERADSDDGRLAELARHQGGVARPAAAGGKDALRGEHAVHVIGLGLGSDQDDLAPVVAQPLGSVRVERGHADSGTGGHIQAGGDQSSLVCRLLTGCGGELWVEEEVDLARG